MALNHSTQSADAFSAPKDSLDAMVLGAKKQRATDVVSALGDLTPAGAALAERLAWAGEQGAELARQPWAAAAWEKLEQAQWGFAILRALRHPERPAELWGAKALAEDGMWKFDDWEHSAQMRAATTVQKPPAWAQLAESFASDWACEEAGRLALATQALGGGRGWIAPSRTEWEGPGLPSQARPTGLLLAALIAAAKRAAKTNPLAEEILPELLKLEDGALRRSPVAATAQQQAPESSDAKKNDLATPARKSRGPR